MTRGSAEGALYRRSERALAVGAAGLRLSASWEHASGLLVFLRLDGLAGLAKGELVIEGTDARYEAPDVEGLASVGVGWRFGP